MERKKGATLKKELRSAIISFAEVQQRHISFLATSELKTLSGWNEKRQHVLLRLKQCLEQISSSDIKKDSELAGMVRKAIGNMQSGEKQLAALVGQQQRIISEKLRTMRKGKTVLKGYSLCHGKGSQPTYLSSRT